MSWRFVSSLASADPSRMCSSLLDQKGNRLQVQTTDPKVIAVSIRVQGARLLLAEQGNHLAVLRLDGAALDLSPSISAPSPGRPSSSICSADATSIAPASGSTARSCSRAGWPAAAGDGGGAGGETAGRPAARTKAPAAGQFGAAHYGLRLPDDAPLGRWTINLKTAAGSRF